MSEKTSAPTVSEELNQGMEAGKIHIDRKSLGEFFISRAADVTRKQVVSRSSGSRLRKPKTEEETPEHKKLNMGLLSTKEATVSPSNEKSPGKIRYAVTPSANKKLLEAYVSISKLSNMMEKTGIKDISKKDFDRTIMKPIETLIMSETKRKTVHHDTFSAKRTVTSGFIKIYRKLEKEGSDVSDINYDEENETCSMVDASKMMRLYISYFDLKGGEKTSRFPLDPFLKKVFSKESLHKLYTKNGDEVVTHGQLQTLAFLLVGPIVKE